jgi:hypothetical protein
MVDNNFSFRQRAVIEFLGRRFPLLLFTTDFSVCIEIHADTAWVLAVLDDG